MSNVRITPRGHIPRRCNEKQPCAVLRLLTRGLSQLLRQYDWFNLWDFTLTLSYSSIKPHNTLLYSESFCAVFKAATSAL